MPTSNQPVRAAEAAASTAIAVSGETKPLLQVVTAAAAEKLTVTVFETLQAAEAAWRALEKRAVTTPYQRFDWISAFVAAQGRSDRRFAIVLLGEGERHVALLPLEIKRRRGIAEASIIAEDIGNSDWLMVDPEAVPQLDHDRLLAALREAGRIAGIDALALYNLPVEFAGLANPLLAFPHQPGPDNFYVGRLDEKGSFDRFDAKRLSNLERRKRKLAEATGPVELRRATTVEEIDRVHKVFLEQRAVRFAQQGIRNIFGEAEFVKFFRQAAIASLGQERPAIAFHGLYAGDTIIATSCGTYAGTHYSQYINSTTSDQSIVKHRIVGILMHELFKDVASLGVTSIDMGLGDFDYKTDWTVPEMVHDAVIPLNRRGAIAAAAILAFRRLKRSIKQNQTIFGLFKRARAMARGQQAGASMQPEAGKDGN